VIRSWAKSAGHQITVVYREEGVSGAKDLENRPELAHVLHQIRTSQVAGVVVARLDRLARDLILQEQLLAEVRRLGGDVWSTSAAEQQFLADDPADPSRKLIRQVLGAVSEYERAMIALRLAAGRARKAETGYAYGAPPLGYRSENRTLVADPVEARTVQRIKDLHDSGRSLREIAARLREEGYSPKRSDRWHPETLRQVIRRAERVS
jgi:DNA invertase Pin-like site-specific DNA recombinase